MRANEPVASDELIERLWGGKPPATAPNTLQHYVSELRKLLPAETLLTQAPGYLLRVEPEQIDLVRFEQLAKEGKQALASGEPDRAARLLDDALDLWRGPALADFMYESWALPETQRLEERRLAAVEDSIDARLALGEHAEVVSDLEVLIREHPLREGLRSKLMVALYRSGRQGEALDAYQQARDTLLQDLGIDPSPALQALNKQILNQDEAIAAPVAPAKRPRTNLPEPPTALIGRERELTEVTALLGREDVRLLTLTGPGGTGKTRLALQAAAEASNDYQDGVFWVGLASLRDPSLVTATIAQTLGTKGELVRHIGTKELLLLLDNLEQLVDCAPELAQHLAACPGLALLVTSREPLHLSGEHEYPVPALAEPDAVSLFRERALAVRPDFSADGEITEICRRLDHLPLAVELAAARVKAFSPKQILARLEQRLPLLTGGTRDLPERQRTLRATIEWSYDLLSEDEQRLFARLAVFADGCTLEAAEQICAADLDTLQALVDKSLLRHSNERYWMLETIREYAAKRLEASGERDNVSRVHAEWYAALARRAAVTLQSPQQLECLTELDRDQANLRAAAEWGLLSDDVAISLCVLGELWRFWEARVLIGEARRLLAEALRRSAEAPEDARARALFADGRMALRQGDYGGAEASFDTAYDLYGERNSSARALCLAGLGWVAQHRGDLGRAAEVGEESLVLGRASGDEWTVSDALNNLGCTLLELGDLTRARKLHEEGLVLRRRIGDLEGVGAALANLGVIALEEGDLVTAEPLLQEARSYAEQRGDIWARAAVLALLAFVVLEHGDTGQAEALCLEALEEASRSALEEVAGGAFGVLAAVEAVRGDFELAARLWGSARSQSGELPVGWRTLRDQIATARATVDEPTWAAREAAGEAMSLDEAVASALEHAKVRPA